MTLHLSVGGIGIFTPRKVINLQITHNILRASSTDFTMHTGPKVLLLSSQVYGGWETKKSFMNENPGEWGDDESRRDGGWRFWKVKASDWLTGNELNQPRNTSPLTDSQKQLSFPRHLYEFINPPFPLGKTFGAEQRGEQQTVLSPCTIHEIKLPPNKS